MKMSFLGYSVLCVCIIFFISAIIAVNETSKLIPCMTNDDCEDFNMVCCSNCTPSACVCSKLYYWDVNLERCVINEKELKEFLASLKEETDHRARIDRQAISTFNQLGLAGIMALSLGFIGSILCVFFFCVTNVMANQSYRDLKASDCSEAPGGPSKDKSNGGDAGLSIAGLSSIILE